MKAQDTIDQIRNNNTNFIVRLYLQANCLHQMKQHKKYVLTCALNHTRSKNTATQNFVNNLPEKLHNKNFQNVLNSRQPSTEQRC